MITQTMRAAHRISSEKIRSHEGESAAVPWWSFTKLVIATAALRLVEIGSIELDAPMYGEGFSLRQLLQHESGLPDYGWLKDYHDAVANGDTPWPPEEAITRATDAHPRLPPGSRWAYSNIGYYVAGQIVSAATGSDLGRSLKTLVLTPAGLHEARLASTRAGLEGVQMGPARNCDPGWVLHGLLVGPLAEAATFLHCLLSGGIIGEPMLAEMLKVRLLPEHRSELWPDPAYGLGIMGGWNGPASPFGHSGEGPGSAIAVYGRRTGKTVTVAAEWLAPGSARQAEAGVLQALAL